MDPRLSGSDLGGSGGGLAGIWGIWGIWGISVFEGSRGLVHLKVGLGGVYLGLTLVFIL